MRWTFLLFPCLATIDALGSQSRVLCSRLQFESVWFWCAGESGLCSCIKGTVHAATCYRLTTSSPVASSFYGPSGYLGLLEFFSMLLFGLFSFKTDVFLLIFSTRETCILLGCLVPRTCFELHCNNFLSVDKNACLPKNLANFTTSLN